MSPPYSLSSIHAGSCVANGQNTEVHVLQSLTVNALESQRNKEVKYKVRKVYRTNRTSVVQHRKHIQSKPEGIASVRLRSLRGRTKFRTPCKLYSHE